MTHELGMVAFNAYTRHTGDPTHDGNPIPGWDQLGDTIQGAWHAAAQAAVTHDRQHRDDLQQVAQQGFNEATGQ